MLLFPALDGSFVTMDRRAAIRFPLRASVKYVVADSAGDAVSLDISRRSISLLTSSRLSAGCWIRLWIDWPVQLNGHLPLYLVVQGMVRRSTASQAAIIFSRYEFRLQPPRPPSAA
ncbi:MAG TPA: hypothetical protein VGF16_02000 [Bryobacteraceae bacterium]